MTAQRQEPIHLMTAAEFQQLYGDSDNARFELVDGEVRAMSPASSIHGTIQARMASLIDGHLDRSRSPCRVVTEPAIAVRVRADANVRVPDLGVSCVPDAPGQVLLPDPILLIEILSPSNAGDTWGNVWAYTTIPTVVEIVLLHSTEILAEVLRRESDGNWPPETMKVAAGQTLALASIGFECPIEAVYARTHLQVPPAS